MSDRVSKEFEAQAVYLRFGVENVSQKYIQIIDVNLLSYKIFMKQYDKCNKHITLVTYSRCFTLTIKTKSA